MPTVLSSLSLIAFVFFIKKCWDYLRSSSSSSATPYPPGPPPKLLLGNAADFPFQEPGKVYMEMEKKYNSSIIHLGILGNHVVVINKREDADELFDRRASKYSDRPYIPILNIMGWGYNVALIRYGEEWRFHRKIMQQNFRQEAIKDYHPLQTDKVNQFLENLVRSPQDLEKHNKMLSIALPMSTMYGYDADSPDDPAIVAADESIRLGGDLIVPGHSMINFIPVLQYLPTWFPGSRKTAHEVNMKTQAMRDIPVDFVKKSLANGTRQPSLVGNMMERKQHHEVSKAEEEAVLNIAYTVYGAASDTTISATGSFFYLMTIHPEVQRKAQAEIDAVIGNSRLPTFEDRTSLPYVEAIYREVLRWSPPLPMGAPHSLTEDDYFKGYFIPKGTTVFGNIWAMTHDPEVYPEPDLFKPERFFDKKGNLNDDSRVLAYGFGRRVCVGKYIASSTLWLMMASVLATLNLQKAKDEHGNEIEINDEYGDFGFGRHKISYKSSITPRSSLAKQLILDSRTY